MQVRNSIWMKFDCVRFCSEILTPSAGFAVQCCRGEMLTLRDFVATRGISHAQTRVPFPFPLAAVPLQAFGTQEPSALRLFRRDCPFASKLAKGQHTKKSPALMR